MTQSDTAALAAVIREEIVRQYRDNERKTWPGGAFDYEEHQSPWLIAQVVLAALPSSAALERQTVLEEALKPFAKIELPPNATDGTWVARTIYCNDQVTAHSVWKARMALYGRKDQP